MSDQSLTDAEQAERWTLTAKMLRQRATNYNGLAKSVLPSRYHLSMAEEIRATLVRHYSDLAEFYTEKAEYAELVAMDFAHGSDGVAARQMNRDLADVNAEPFGKMPGRVA